jgi:hypothetical protein
MLSTFFKHLVLVLALSALLSACSEQEDWSDIESTEFTRAAVQPDWFAKTTVYPLSTLEDMNTLWRSHKRCCDKDSGVTRSNREFYKSCYVAVYNALDDPDLAPYCLWLMDVALDYEQGTNLSKYLLKNYPSYKQRVDNCANCTSGDLIARVTRDVALFEFYQEDKTEEAFTRMDNMLADRVDEISLWVMVDIYKSMAEMLIKMNAPSDRAYSLRQRVDALAQIWPADSNQHIELVKASEALLTLETE